MNILKDKLNPGAMFVDIDNTITGSKDGMEYPEECGYE